MGYDKETKRVSVDSFEVAEEKGDGKLGGKRGGKPFYKQTWFLWTAGAATLVAFIGVIVCWRLDRAGLEKNYANMKDETEKMLKWDSDNSTTTDAFSRTSTYSGGSIDRTATASIARPSTDLSPARPSLTETTESSLSATESETLRNTATA